MNGTVNQWCLSTGIVCKRITIGVFKPGFVSLMSSDINVNRLQRSNAWDCTPISQVLALNPITRWSHWHCSYP